MHLPGDVGMVVMMMLRAGLNASVVRRMRSLLSDIRDGTVGERLAKVNEQAMRGRGRTMEGAEPLLEES